MMLAAAIVAAGIFAGAYVDGWFERPLTGVATVVDGDTLDLHGTRVRLWGVDAPEWNTPMGAVAKITMRQLLAKGPLTCHDTEARSHGRTVATCSFQDGEDLGRDLIRMGVALDCPGYSNGFYADDEPSNARNLIRPSPYCGV